MIVCSCMGISDREIRAAVGWMRAADPDTIITPGKVYRALGKRADCGGCMPLFLATMRDHEGFAVREGEAVPQVPAALRNLRMPASPRLGARQSA